MMIRNYIQRRDDFRVKMSQVRNKYPNGADKTWKSELEHDS